MNRNALVGALLLAVACGPSHASSESDEATGAPSGSSTVDSASAATGDETSGADTAPRTSSDDPSDPTETSGTSGGFGSWGDPQVVAQLGEAASLSLAGDSLFAVGVEQPLVWRIDTGTFDLDEIPLSGFGSTYNEATSGYVYLGQDACGSRLAVDSLGVEVLAWVQVGMGCHAGPAGAAFLETVVISPPPRRELAGSLLWLPDDQNLDEPIPVFEAPELTRVLAATSTFVAVVLGSDLATIDVESGVATSLVASPTWLPEIGSVFATEERLYVHFPRTDELRIVTFDNGAESLLTIPADHVHSASLERIAARDVEAPSRLWAATALGDGIEEVVESELPISDVVVSADAIYWIDFDGRVFVIAIPT